MDEETQKDRARARFSTDPLHVALQQQSKSIHRNEKDVQETLGHVDQILCDYWRVEEEDKLTHPPEEPLKLSLLRRGAAVHTSLLDRRSVEKELEMWTKDALARQQPFAMQQTTRMLELVNEEAAAIGSAEAAEKAATHVLLQVRFAVETVQLYGSRILSLVRAAENDAITLPEFQARLSTELSGLESVLEAHKRDKMNRAVAERAEEIIREEVRQKSLVRIEAPDVADKKIAELQQALKESQGAQEQLATQVGELEAKIGAQTATIEELAHSLEETRNSQEDGRSTDDAEREVSFSTVHLAIRFSRGTDTCGLCQTTHVDKGANTDPLEGPVSEPHCDTDVSPASSLQADLPATTTTTQELRLQSRTDAFAWDDSAVSRILSAFASQYSALKKSMALLRFQFSAYRHRRRKGIIEVRQLESKVRDFSALLVQQKVQFDKSRSDNEVLHGSLKQLALKVRYFENALASERQQRGAAAFTEDRPADSERAASDANKGGVAGMEEAVHALGLFHQHVAKQLDSALTRSLNAWTRGAIQSSVSILAKVSPVLAQVRDDLSNSAHPAMSSLVTQLEYMQANTENQLKKVRGVHVASTSTSQPSPQPVLPSSLGATARGLDEDDLIATIRESLTSQCNNKAEERELNAAMSEISAAIQASTSIALPEAHRRPSAPPLSATVSTFREVAKGNVIVVRDQETQCCLQAYDTAPARAPPTKPVVMLRHNFPHSRQRRPPAEAPQPHVVPPPTGERLIDTPCQPDEAAPPKQLPILPNYVDIPTGSRVRGNELHVSSAAPVVCNPAAEAPPVGTKLHKHWLRAQRLEECGKKAVHEAAARAGNRVFIRGAVESLEAQYLESPRTSNPAKGIIRRPATARVRASAFNSVLSEAHVLTSTGIQLSEPTNRMANAASPRTTRASSRSPIYVPYPPVKL